MCVPCTHPVPECTREPSSSVQSRTELSSAELRGTWEVHFNPGKKCIKDVLID